MNDDIRRMHSWIDEHQDEIVRALQGCLRVKSVEGPSAPGAPFGAGPRKALDYTLELARGLGFRARDFDGYAGDAEFGAGPTYVAAIGHLDVVPEGDGWTYDPYGAELADGYLYARGSSDDKGPTYAALFGAKALLDSGLCLKRRVRVIFGCNEESGFGCMKHYFEDVKEERPEYGFTPDAGFPLIYAEKGIANLTLEKPLPAPGSGLRLESASGGLRPNMVPDAARAILSGPREALLAAEQDLLKYWDKNISVERQDGRLLIFAAGKSAHGSHPTAGDNAVARLARCLRTLDLPDGDEWLKWVVETAETTGTALGIARTDEVAGRLTSNMGLLDASGGKARVTYNIRYPVTWSARELDEANRPVREESGWTLATFTDQPPLYVPLDREPVSTLLRVYQEETGDTASKPGTMGGGTYARATGGVVAYGAGFPGGSDGPAHEVDERIAVATVLRAAKVYAHALYELANLQLS